MRTLVWILVLSFGGIAMANGSVEGSADILSNVQTADWDQFHVEGERFSTDHQVVLANCGWQIFSCGRCKRAKYWDGKFKNCEVVNTCNFQKKTISLTCY